MQIQQLQVAAEAIEDRLLLRISTSSQEEIRVFITRRFLRELWPGLTAMLFGHLAAGQPELSRMSTSAVNDETGDSPEESDQSPGGNLPSFDKPYHNDDPNLPLGSTPLLAAEANLTPAGPAQCTLTLGEPKQRSFTLTLNGELLQALCSMLRATSRQLRWELPLDYTAANPVSNESLLPAKQLLH